MQTRRITANGLELELLEAGEGSHDRLLLVHGFTGAKEDFDDHIDALASRGWHVVAALRSMSLAGDAYDRLAELATFVAERSL